MRRAMIVMFAVLTVSPALAQPAPALPGGWADVRGLALTEGAGP